MISRVLRADNTPIPNIKSVSYVERVNSSTDLRPGCVSSAYIQVVVYGAEVSAPAKGEPLKYYQEDANGNTTYIGTFYAEPSVQSRNTYSFIAFDIVDKLDVDFSERLLAIQANFPMTLSALVSEACSVAGVQLLNTTWPMNSMQVQSFYADGLTCRDILSYAAEISCRYVRCDENEKIVFGWYAAKSGYLIYPTIDNNLADTTIAYKSGGLSYKGYSVNNVGCVAVRPINSENAAYIYPSSVSAVYATDPLANGVVTLHNLTAVDDGNGGITLSGDFTTTETSGDVEMQAGSGTPSNVLLISNNILLTNASSATMQAVVQNIYTEMSSLPVYRPASAQLFPMENPFRAGDIVAVQDSQGVSFVMPVMSMNVEPSAATVEATGNQSYDANYGTDIAKQIQNLYNSVVQIDRLKVGYAEIDTAIVNSLTANGINADWIDTGALTVKDANNNVIFEADQDNHTVTISGWTADKDFLSSMGDWMALQLGEGKVSFGSTIGLNALILVAIPEGESIYYHGNMLNIVTSDLSEQESIWGFALSDKGGSQFYFLTVDNSVSPFQAFHEFKGNIKVGSNSTNYGFTLNGVDVKQKVSQIGNLNNLSTTAKNDLVSAINELYTMITS